MSVNAKHLATFILGAAAGAALHKYLKTEDGEKLLEDLKTKAGDLKAEAEGAIDKAPDYFEQLKNKGAETLKSNFPDADKYLRDILETLTGKKATGATSGQDTPPAAS